MTATAIVIPNAEVLTPGAGGFVLNPAPTVPLYQTTPRLGPNPMLYETISPTMTIVVQAVGGCPVDKIPNLITSVTLIPGQGTGGVGTGCSIVKLIDLALEQGITITDIPQYLMSGGFLEPSIVYGTIAGPPVPTMALPNPLKGFYGEKYFYDAEYIYASWFKNSPALDPVDGTIAPNAPITQQNRLTSISLLGGKKQLPFADLDLPEGATQITDSLFPPGIPISFESFVPLDPALAVTIGNDYFTGLTDEISAWVKWKPSFIELMRYNYTLIVTHTCPPFVTVLQGYMIVQNNWMAAANRLNYYIGLQKGFLDFDYEDAETP